MDTGIAIPLTDPFSNFNFPSRLSSQRKSFDSFTFNRHDDIKRSKSLAARETMTLPKQQHPRRGKKEVFMPLYDLPLIWFLKVQPPPLITAIKQIEAPQLDDKIEKEEDFEYCDVEADRVVDFARGISKTHTRWFSDLYLEAEIRKSFDEEIIVGESSRVVSPPSEPAVFSFGISNEKDMILQHQQQLILQKLQQLNDLQKQQIDSNKPKSDFQPIEIREIHHQETPIPSAPPIEEVQLITTNPEPIEVSIAEKNSIVIDIENPLAGRLMNKSDDFV